MYYIFISVIPLKNSYFHLDNQLDYIKMFLFLQENKKIDLFLTDILEINKYNTILLKRIG